MSRAFFVQHMKNFVLVHLRICYYRNPQQVSLKSSEAAPLPIKGLEIKTHITRLFSHPDYQLELWSKIQIFAHEESIHVTYEHIRQKNVQQERKKFEEKKFRRIQRPLIRLLLFSRVNFFFFRVRVRNTKRKKRVRVNLAIDLDNEVFSATCC